jgi:hypothetical protein
MLEESLWQTHTFDPFHLRRLDPFESMVRDLVPTNPVHDADLEEPAIPVEAGNG